MKEYRRKPELLAPAGNKESFIAVLRAGADAVYLAGNKYGARAYADNFSEEELCACICYAHIHNKRVYLTVNTLLTNSELDELYSFLKPMYEVGLDGVIVQDLGVINYIRNHFPNMEIHASTQINTTGIQGINFLKKMGVCRVVPARELSLNEIKEIKQKTDMEIECFIHGAICYCYSGQCLFSSVIGSRSGNRGKCAQPCRLPYSVNGKNEIYPLSLKDMCTIEYLPQLIEAGIDSYKIEGRMKKPEYAAGVTALYRKYIDQYYEKGFVKVTPEDKAALSSLYIRSQISEGYYEKHNGADMITINSPSYSGSDDNVIKNIHDLYVADTAKKCIPKIKLEMSGYFMSGEQAYVSVSYNDIFIIKYGEIVQTAEKKPITAEDIFKQLSKLGSTEFTLDADDTLQNIFVSEDAYYNLKGINELRRAAISELEEKIILAHGLVYSRNASDKDEVASYVSNDFTACTNTVADSTINARKNNSEYSSKRKFNILINDIPQLKSVLRHIETSNKNTNNNSNSNITCKAISRIYIPEELFLDSKTFEINTNLINILVSFCSNNYNVDFYIAMPYVRRMRDAKILSVLKKSLLENTKLIKGVLVRNIEDLNLISEMCANGAELEIVFDYGIYAWNRESIAFAEKFSTTIGMPLELCGAAQRELAATHYGCVEKMIYGRIPLMHTANCINKTMNKCRINEHIGNEERWAKITDRTKRELPIFTDCIHCQNTIYNAIPITITKELKDYPNNFVFRIDFTDESGEQINHVLDYYLLGTGSVDWEYTKAFEKHSTE